MQNAQLCNERGFTTVKGRLTISCMCRMQVVRDPAKDLSRQTALQGVPVQVVRKLQAAQDEADVMNKRLKV